MEQTSYLFRHAINYKISRPTLRNLEMISEILKQIIIANFKIGIEDPRSHFIIYKHLILKYLRQKNKLKICIGSNHDSYTLLVFRQKFKPKGQLESASLPYAGINIFLKRLKLLKGNWENMNQQIFIESARFVLALLSKINCITRFVLRGARARF